MKCYLASGWFTPEQERERMILLQAIEESGIDFYSPKDEMEYDPKTMKPIDVLEENIKQIIMSDFVLASTEGKDMGTVFECGYSLCMHKPVVYWWPNSDMTMNLMLAASAYRVIDTYQGLVEFLTNCTLLDYLPVQESEWEGEVE